MQMFNDKELEVILEAMKTYQEDYVLDDEVIVDGIITKIEGTFRLVNYILDEDE